MRILALEAYYGGSHRAFLDGWSGASEHEWTVLTLPAYKWKWRMRHGAITFADQLRQRTEHGQDWDLVFCSDMLNLAEFRGLAPVTIRDLPTIAYFHENQLTYPVRFESERDYQFAVTNMTTALAADSVWFNSEFHRNSFLGALSEFLQRMPDHQPFDAVERIASKSQVRYPGISEISRCSERQAGPLRILWAARWEHDKRPEDFFGALKTLKENNVDFRISVIGEQFREVPHVFESARKDFADRIDHWGYQQSRARYEEVLGQADVIVSTTDHEFFGIGILEAGMAGAFPLLPKRLSYPELLELENKPENEKFFYDGSIKELASKLTELADNNRLTNLRQEQLQINQTIERFKWNNLAHVLDEAIEGVLHRNK
ncbi:MAG: tRNA-queuosine alpha-mannosyltransferase domain-containing protein [Planctomycetota bacterium]|jgi:glycosyltransferase involved in cell wall biosynthesis